jgi:thiol-disulfide isomerase/thioredoxin
MKTHYIFGGLIILVIVGLVYVRNSASNEDTQVVTSYDTFAECLGNAGAKFYGAYWCPHCQDQKKLFQNSKKLPYIECSTPDGKGQTPVCIDAKITGYPTWEFIDGSRADGKQSIEELSKKTNCSLPQ